MYAGAVLQLGGREFVAPPLSRGGFKRFAVRLAAAAREELTGPEMLDLAADVLYAALLRNYPTLSQDEFDELTDNMEIMAAFELVMRKSMPTASGEAPASP